MKLLAAVVSIAALLTPTAVAADDEKIGYVYLGICDSGTGWSNAHLAPLAACAATGEQKVSTLRGLKVRGYYPDGKFAPEVARLGKGRSVQLLETRCMCGQSPKPGPHVYWGKIRY
jgi:hypothetical protein